MGLQFSETIMVIITLTVPFWQKTARMAAEIIPGADVSIKTLQIIVEGIIGVDRKIAIAFTNLTDVSSYHARQYAWLTRNLNLKSKLKSNFGLYES